MVILLLVFAAALIALSVYLHKSADAEEKRFANRPEVITNPKVDLFTNEKYAIVQLIAYVQGASPQSAFSSEANAIAESVFSSLGITNGEVEKLLKSQMNGNPERQAARIIGSLHEIRDKNYLKELYLKCMRIADISGDEETKDSLNIIFKEELGIN